MDMNRKEQEGDNDPSEDPESRYSDDESVDDDQHHVQRLSNDELPSEQQPANQVNEQSTADAAHAAATADALDDLSPNDASGNRRVIVQPPLLPPSGATLPAVLTGDTIISALADKPAVRPPTPPTATTGVQIYIVKSLIRLRCIHSSSNIFIHVIPFCAGREADVHGTEADRLKKANGLDTHPTATEEAAQQAMKSSFELGPIDSSIGSKLDPSAEPLNPETIEPVFEDPFSWTGSDPADSFAESHEINDVKYQPTLLPKQQQQQADTQPDESKQGGDDDSPLAKGKAPALPFPTPPHLSYYLTLPLFTSLL